MYQPLSLKIIGVAPFIQHNGELSNPLNPIVKEMKKVSSKRNKTDADLEELAHLEFLGSLYMGEDGPVIPAEMLEACIIGGAKKLKQGPAAKSGIVCMEHAKLEYKGPREAEKLWANEKFRLVSRVKVQSSSVMRTRPIFRNWSATLTLEYEDSVLNDRDVREFAEKAGMLVGIGDWRPKHGRFTVE